MTKREKVNFVLQLVTLVAGDIAAKINAGDVPDEWDGIHLRWLLAEKISSQTYGKPTKEYENDVLVNNL